ncbi:TIGR03111 family XrtG-associated glycosyltransferase [Limosilactobacillus sp.]|uniref:TIGR03111 family XrtG-associated glycosyltransferase n=1 Tax=Limosilactobacillus sp. TaxID=2773925 RepID=UPI003F03D485
MIVTTELLIQLGFWLSWMLIPIIYELFPALFSFMSLRRATHHLKLHQSLRFYPRISLIIPVYNSADTLYQCIQSVAESTYPTNLISIIVANNQSTDNSFVEYQRAHANFHQLFMQWIDTDKGKARALNSAIYNSQGKYIIHIDSDGVLEKDALKNMISTFEEDSSIDALTGTILTQRNLIRRTPRHWLKFLRENEYYEYAQSFLAGRAVESQGNRLFTMSGAFSAFRRERLLQTHLYNTETVGEDIDMTFQIRYQLKGKVILCPEAIFYVTPIDNLGHLYTQRQRWQRGELEAIHYFMADRVSIRDFFGNFIVRRLVFDHTILFLRIIWIAAFIVLIPLGYSPQIVGFSFLVLYIMYVGLSLLNFINIQAYLKNFPADRHYYLTKWYILFSLPLYYLLCSVIQVIGIINAMTEPAKWKVSSFGEEANAIVNVIKNDFNWWKGRSK